jgi:hypothetical protein
MVRLVGRQLGRRRPVSIDRSIARPRPASSPCAHHTGGVRDQFTNRTRGRASALKSGDTGAWGAILARPIEVEVWFGFSLGSSRKQSGVNCKRTGGYRAVCWRWCTHFVRAVWSVVCCVEARTFGHVQGRHARGGCSPTCCHNSVIIRWFIHSISPRPPTTAGEKFPTNECRSTSRHAP